MLKNKWVRGLAVVPAAVVGWIGVALLRQVLIDKTGLTPLIANFVALLLVLALLAPAIAWQRRRAIDDLIRRQQQSADTDTDAGAVPEADGHLAGEQTG